MCVCVCVCVCARACVRARGRVSEYAMKVFKHAITLVKFAVGVNLITITGGNGAFQRAIKIMGFASSERTRRQKNASS